MERAIAGLAVGLLIGLASATRPSKTLVAVLRGLGGGGGGLRAGFRGLPADLAACGLLVAALLLLPGLREEALSGFWVRVPGGLLLVLLGWRMMGGSLSEGRSGAGSALEAPPAPGMFADLSDPLWHLFWWPAVLVLVTAFAGEGLAAAVCFGGGILMGRYGWRVYLASRASRSRYGRAFTERQYRVFTSLGGLLLAGAGLWAVVAMLASTGVRPALERAAFRIFS